MITNIALIKMSTTTNVYITDTNGVYRFIAVLNGNNSKKHEKYIDLIRRTLTFTGHEYQTGFGSMTKQEATIIGRLKIAILEGGVTKERGYEVIENMIQKKCSSCTFRKDKNERDN